MKNISLYIPKLEDLWFREKCLTDPNTMSYNKGYHLDLAGYNQNDGTILFPKESWQNWYNKKMLDNSFFYAYILDNDTKNFVGHLNIKIDEEKVGSVGIVIFSDFRGQGYTKPSMELMFKKAKELGVKSLIDTIPKDREISIKVFLEMGFKVKRELYIKKFNFEELIYEVEKVL